MHTALYMPALVQRDNPVVRRFAKRLKTKSHAPKAIIGICIAKMAMLIFGILRFGLPFDPTSPVPSLKFKIVSDPANGRCSAPNLRLPCKREVGTRTRKHQS